MNVANHNSYLETEVLTGSPQKLRLMLIDGALRFLGEAKLYWQQRNFERGGESLDRARAIVNELIASIDRDQLPEVSQRLIDLYSYLHQALVTAGFEHDQGTVENVIRLLAIERETWRLVCDALAHSQPPAPHIQRARSPLAADPADEYHGGFSVEA